METREIPPLLTRPRFVRFTAAQDERLVEEARKQNRTVSYLLRNAAIEAFLLPVDGKFSPRGMGDSGVTGHENHNDVSREVQHLG